MPSSVGKGDVAKGGLEMEEIVSFNTIVDGIYQIYFIYEIAVRPHCSACRIILLKDQM